MDTIILENVFYFNAYYLSGILPPHGGYHTANFTRRGNTDTIGITLRSDTGELLDEIDYNYSYFTSRVCFKGKDYLATIAPRYYAIDTLFNSQTGIAEHTLPAGIRYENQAAMLSTVVGQCDPDLPERVALVYNQPTAQRILFTDADTTVQAELHYQDFAFAYRIDKNVYAQSDLDENGCPANTIYRIGEQISNTYTLEEPIEIILAPNPVHNFFQVFTDESFAEAGDLQVFIYSLSGQEVAKYSGVLSGQLLKSPTTPGVYVVQLIQPTSVRRVAEKLVVR